MSEREELLEVFKGEVSEQLDGLDDALSLPPARWNTDELFHLAHNVKGAGRVIGAYGFAEVAHQLEELFSAVRRGAEATQSVGDAAREGLALLRRCLEDFEEGIDPGDTRGYGARVADALGLASPGVASSELSSARGTGEAPGEPDLREEPAPEAAGPALGEQAAAPRMQPSSGEDRPASPTHSSTVRVGVDKLQALTGLGSELITSSHRTELRREQAGHLLGNLGELRRRHPELHHSDAFRAVIQASKRLVRELQKDGLTHNRLSEQLRDAIHELRMVQIDTVRGLLVRAVRSASAATGRQVEFRSEGGSTQVDRAILERLRDPLVHLVRNAVAHGIEAPGDRLAAGKLDRGRVTFSARSAGSWVEIVVEDDGRGVDLERVRDRASSLGLLDAEKAASASADELLDLVFRPGFSTAEQVSELAGRGFGMDIVRTNLAEIGGSAYLTSIPGRGTCVRLRAPLTRLTIRALVVSAAGQLMAFPMIGLQRTVAVRRVDVKTVDAVQVIPVDDTLVPVSHVARALGLEGPAPDESIAVVLAEGDRLRAFLVDQVIGEKEITVQALPWNLQHMPGISGASGTESGEVLLVLNGHDLVVAPGVGLSATRVEDGRGTRQYRILVVDDSVTSRTLEKNILSSAGYDVLMAVNGHEALQLLRDHHVDLVVTDVDMPLLDGIGLTRTIRSTDGLEELPVILVTSLGSDDDKQQGADAGADAHIVKGAFDQDELLGAVSRLL